MGDARQEFFGKTYLMLNTLAYLKAHDLLTVATANSSLQKTVYNHCQMGIMRDKEAPPKREVRIKLDREIPALSKVMLRIVDAYHVKVNFQDREEVDHFLLFAKRVWAESQNHRRKRPVVVMDCDADDLTLIHGDFGEYDYEFRVHFTNSAARRSLKNGLRKGFIIPSAFLYNIRDSVFGELMPAFFEYVISLEVLI